jgi:tRNA A37 threonylcarbamoyladenosine biosynthesis protein TsaE
MWVLLLIQMYQGAAELYHVELYQTLEECTADMWEIAPRLEANEAMFCMEANI